MLITINKSVFKNIVTAACLLATVNAYADSEDLWTNSIKKWGNDFITTQNLQVGVDHWFGVPANTSNDLLMNGTATGHYSDAIPWGKYTGTFKPFSNNRSKINLHMMADIDNGFQLQRFDYDYSITKAIGVRFGLVNMKMNLCRVYESDNPWMMEASTSCRTNDVASLYRSTNSSPGAQIYLNTTFDDWFLSYQVGYYKPNFLNYDDTEYGFSRYLTDYNAGSAVPNKTAQNDKLGFNFQAFNPVYDLDFRTGLLLAKATAMGVPDQNFGLLEVGGSQVQRYWTASRPDKNQYGVIFSSLRTSLFGKVGLTFTFNYYTGTVNTPAPIVNSPGYIFTSNYVPFIGGNTKTTIQNYGAELLFPITHSSKLALYLGENLEEYTNIITSQHYDRTIISTSYRSDFSNGLYYVIQGMAGRRSDKRTWVPQQNLPEINGVVTEYVLGTRLGYQF
jgi:hypothetical protein